MTENRSPVVSFILYGSIANAPFSDQELLALLDGARSFNRQHQLTGMLLYKNGAFLQLLEGPIGELEALYARIEKDPRHRSVSIILCGEAERQFENWSMAFENLTNWRSPRIFQSASDLLSAPFDPIYFGANPSQAQQFILAFRGRGGAKEDERSQPRADSAVGQVCA